jgi:hypothetical protein
MRKTRMLRRLICEMRQPELANPPQPLKFRRINQPNQQLAFLAVGNEANYIVNRIPVNSLCQYLSPLVV